MTRAAAALVLAGFLLTAAPLAQDRAFESPPAAARNHVDELVFARLKRLNIPPAPLSSDAVFVRRAFTDTIGTLPTAVEAAAFIADTSPDKRRALIDRLLDREEFADYWSMKWGDTLRIKSEFPIDLWPNAVQSYHQWIHAALRRNMPYDEFARTLLTGSGSNFRVGPVNFYRAVQSRDPQAMASAVALTFMGARTASWPAERVTAMAAFFSKIGYKPTGEWKEEIVYFDPDKGPAHATDALVFPDGTKGHLAPGEDPREAFAAWLVSPKNPWFTQAIANRVWFWLMGRGIVQEPDDIRPDNPASNPELLDYLQRELVDAHFDLKALYRLILNSATYQLSSRPAADTPDAAANFAAYAARPLDAEVLIDAICDITGTTEQYSSAIPEPFTFTPPGQRAIALSDGSVTSAFLQTFGRPARDTGLLLERNSNPTPAARLYLLNSSDIQRRIQQGPKLTAVIQSTADLRQLANRLYLTILSRMPTEEELKTLTAYAQTAGNKRTAAIDVAWALINSVEFLYRH